jgi:hypothetical protein
VEDTNTGWVDKYLCDPNMVGLTQNMKQKVSNIVIDMSISHDRHYQQVETDTMTGTYGVPVTESHKVAKYWATQFHKASLKITGSKAGRSIMKRLQEKRVELVKCPSPFFLPKIKKTKRGEGTKIQTSKQNSDRDLNNLTVQIAG